MTFEQWWEREGKEQVREVYREAADSFAALEESFRRAVRQGWNAASRESKTTTTPTPFETWWELHESECPEQASYNKNCFELCWNTAITEAEHDLARQLNGNKIVLDFEHLKNP